MSEWADGNEPDADDQERIMYGRQDCNIYDTPCRQNLRLLEQQFIEWHVIIRRATFMDEIREGFKATGFFEFFKAREYLWSTIFPPESSFNYRPADVIRVIRYVCEGELPVQIKQGIEEFISNLGNSRDHDLIM